MKAPRVIASLTVALALAVSALGVVTTAEAGTYDDPTTSLPRKKSPWPGVGPNKPYVQEILINTVIPLKNEAIINRTQYGYLFRAGQQHNNLTVTHDGKRLRFVDTGTASWKWLPAACSRISVPQGIGATCAFPSTATESSPMLLEVWPRLGNDVVDTTALKASVDVAFLGDKGYDVARFGAGDDFFNGAQEGDKGFGGAGRDWIRTGIGNDRLEGGADGDVLVGVDEADTILGGPGDDLLQGLDGSDTIYAGDGSDTVYCGNGSDRAWVKSSDRATLCETLNRS